MNAAAILASAEAAGVRVEAAGDRLRLIAATPPPPALLQALSGAKGELLVLLERRADEVAEREAIQTNPRCRYWARRSGNASSPTIAPYTRGFWPLPCKILLKSQEAEMDDTQAAKPLNVVTENYKPKAQEVTAMEAYFAERRKESRPAKFESHR